MSSTTRYNPLEEFSKSDIKLLNKYVERVEGYFEPKIKPSQIASLIDKEKQIITKVAINQFNYDENFNFGAYLTEREAEVIEKIRTGEKDEVVFRLRIPGFIKNRFTSFFKLFQKPDKWEDEIVIESTNKESSRYLYPLILLLFALGNITGELSIAVVQMVAYLFFSVMGITSISKASGNWVKGYILAVLSLFYTASAHGLFYSDKYPDSDYYIYQILGAALFPLIFSFFWRAYYDSVFIRDVESINKHRTWIYTIIMNTIVSTILTGVGIALLYAQYLGVTATNGYILGVEIFILLYLVLTLPKPLFYDLDLKMYLFETEVKSIEKTIVKKSEEIKDEKLILAVDKDKFSTYVDLSSKIFIRRNYVLLGLSVLSLILVYLTLNMNDRTWIWIADGSGQDRGSEENFLIFIVIIASSIIGLFLLSILLTLLNRLLKIPLTRVVNHLSLKEGNITRTQLFLPVGGMSTKDYETKISKLTTLEIVIINKEGSK